MSDCIYRAGYKDDGSKKIIWTERAPAGGSGLDDPFCMLDRDDADVARKAAEAGVEIPLGKDRALEVDVIVEKIIAKLTYAI
ncbi:hypothetical protein [Nitrososphaera viennensis]|uniref:Uncharacterized protein n=1 Tax=Nitrososphaera viennensis TaxID=1034015 RepID=A0A977NND3_9ARCH|nr:hypothetical protein [Nitrososphaera viennensis]UVS70416.1 hypothetical protein NWT39_06425 [Nitrososphaera viennensis]